tara:strand:- start:220 stop:867 length:648 start_codon:yes stop_codon:yes gene_type:complete
MLADMGVDVWVARRSSAAQREQNAVASAPVVPEQPVSEPALAQPAATPPQIDSRPHAPPGQEAPLRQEAPLPAPSADAPQSNSNDDPGASATAMHVVCMVSGRAVILADDCVGDARRLLADVVIAAGQAGSGGVRQLTFDWEGEADTGRRAFGAFVDKQLVDHAPDMILCSSALVPHLPGEADQLPIIELPGSAALGGSVDLKRDLWRQIQIHLG